MTVTGGRAATSSLPSLPRCVVPPLLDSTEDFTSHGRSQLVQRAYFWESGRRRAGGRAPPCGPAVQEPGRPERGQPRRRGAGQFLATAVADEERLLRGDTQPVARDRVDSGIGLRVPD